MYFGIFLGVVLTLYLINLELNSSIASGGVVELGGMAVVMTLLSVSLIIYSYKDYRLRKRRQWPHAMGRIEDAKHEKSQSSGNKIRIEYSYRVNDRDLYNDSFDFGQRLATKAQLKMHPELRKFDSLNNLKGKLVKVYYNRDNPRESAISRRVDQTTLITTIPSIVVIIFCIYSLSKIAFSAFS